MENSELFYIAIWGVMLIGFPLLNWFVARTAVRVERNKGGLGIEQAEKRIKQNEKNRLYTGYAFFAVIVLRFLVALFASRGFNDFVSLIDIPIGAVFIGFVVRYWTFVYYYSKELAELRAKQ